MAAIPQFENIPVELRERKQWVCSELPSKRPVQPNGKAASSTDSATWSTFEACQESATKRSWGIGFVFTADDPYTVIDLDHVRNAATEETESWALAIIDELCSYAEVSLSQTGWHIIVRGKLSGPGNKVGRVEMYDHAKVVTLTGNTVPFVGDSAIAERDLSALHARMLERKLGDPKATSTPKVTHTTGDASKDDFALAVKLAREYGGDPEKTKAEFLKQAPQRSKLQRPDYIERTVQKAVSVVLNSKPNTEHESQIHAETFADVQEKPLLWLWKNRIPKNKVTIFGGNPDAGKSLVSLDLTARLTKGKDFPDGEKNEMGPVDAALLFCEDDAADTVKPRLLAAGADCAKAYRLFSQSAGKDGSKKERHIAFDTDLLKLEQFLLEHRDIRFLVVDPISSYLGEASMVKETDVRRVLIPLAELAARLEITVLLIAHLNKRSDVSALHKIMGAVAISGVARAAWMFAADPEDEDSYLMLRGKLNVGKKTEGLRYSIEAKQIPDCGEAPFIKWEGTTNVSAGQVLGLFGPMETGKADKTAEATTWLKGFLSAGSKTAADVISAAAREGIKERTLKRAKSECGAVSFKQGDTWFWRLPGSNEGCQIEDAIA